MSITSELKPGSVTLGDFFTPGMLWFLVACAGAALFFADGLDALLLAWSRPEYSHGPLIPVLSGLLFLRQLKEVPIQTGPIKDRWPGVFVVALSLGFALLGKMANISDIVAYGVIIWIFGILLISFGWRVGLLFWPPVLHLVYMLPLPDTFYYKFSAWLQLVSSELGVWFLGVMNVPVFLEGNIIDLGVLKLHVAEACSGLRYLFPILSFSYIFAVLYRGPMWHKAVLLISAAPITVLMNSVRIAVAGVIAQEYGVEWLDGFTHFFEGWVIFLACIVLLFGLARIMLMLQPEKMSLSEALDLETDGLGTQAARLRLIQASPAMITAACLSLFGALAWQAVPQPERGEIERDSFVTFPRTIGDWRQDGPAVRLDPAIERTLKADDYRSANFVNSDAAASIELFMAWYADQTNGGVHSPEVCLPGAGWEIAWIERADISQQLDIPSKYNVNRAIIQKGETRLMVLYWFQQRERRIAWDIAAKFWLMVDGIRTGRTDGGLIRLTTPILEEETDAQAEARLFDMLSELRHDLPRFMPEE
ncbi:VPLPA-CTERM-specific exosortase XrtD [Tropicimonas sp. S265A]|uniref:VPLPA-CTERM-specific exosortase XrtD n=1 Tax=Tropicimonas sp. S265A TaxID=3415134 RepID=UPI003C7C662D